MGNHNSKRKYKGNYKSFIRRKYQEDIFFNKNTKNIKSIKK